MARFPVHRWITKDKPLLTPALQAARLSTTVPCATACAKETSEAPQAKKAKKAKAKAKATTEEVSAGSCMLWRGLLHAQHVKRVAGTETLCLQRPKEPRAEGDGPHYYLLKSEVDEFSIDVRSQPPLLIRHCPALVPGGFGAPGRRCGKWSSTMEMHRLMSRTWRMRHPAQSLGMA